VAYRRRGDSGNGGSGCGGFERAQSTGGVGLRVRDRDGNDQWYVIEDRDGPLLPGELPPGNPLAQKLVGAPTGAEITVGEPPFGPPVIVQVVEVKSKYLHALHESMRTFQQLFPDTPGLWSVPVSYGNGSNDEPDFQPLFDMISARHSQMLEVRELYRKGMLTIGAVAKCEGSSLIGAWVRLMAEDNPGLLSSTGNIMHLVSTRNLLSGNRLVIDPISVLTLSNLESRDKLTGYYGPFLISQSTVTLFRSELEVT